MHLRPPLRRGVVQLLVSATDGLFDDLSARGRWSQVVDFLHLFTTFLSNSPTSLRTQPARLTCSPQNTVRTTACSRCSYVRSTGTQHHTQHGWASTKAAKARHPLGNTRQHGLRTPLRGSNACLHSVPPLLPTGKRAGREERQTRTCAHIWPNPPPLPLDKVCTKIKL